VIEPMWMVFGMSSEALPGRAIVLDICTGIVWPPTEISSWKPGTSTH